jgi:threonine synthase
LKERGILEDKELVVSVPSGNLGNLTAGLFAAEMGLPVKRFIAANNANDVLTEYLETGVYTPRPSVETIANAMDVGAPSNFARILDLYGHSHDIISKKIRGYRYQNTEIGETVRKVYSETGYLCDPHGACGYQALEDSLQPGEIGVFLETAHPAKFMETMESLLGKGEVILPEKLAAFMKNDPKSFPMENDYTQFRQFLQQCNEIC